MANPGKRSTTRRDFFQNVSTGAAGIAFASVLARLNDPTMGFPQQQKLGSLNTLKNVKHDPYVIELKPWQSIHKSITAPMITALGPMDIPESHLSIGFAYMDKPETLGGPTHKHPHDQWIFLIGGNPKNFLDFDADCEMLLGKEIKKINYPCYFFIPKNTDHCPLEIKRVGKPLVFIDARITEEASVRTGKK